MAAIHSATNCASDNFFINIIAPCMVKIARDDCSMTKIDNNFNTIWQNLPPPPPTIIALTIIAPGDKRSKARIPLSRSGSRSIPIYQIGGERQKRTVIVLTSEGIVAAAMWGRGRSGQVFRSARKFWTCSKFLADRPDQNFTIYNRKASGKNVMTA